MRPMLTAVLTLAASAAFAQTTPSSRAPDADPKASTRTAANVQSDCKKLWEPATHMTKQEWARTCERVQGRLQEIQTIENSAIRLPERVGASSLRR